MLVEQRRRMLGVGLPPMVFGNVPRDNDYLIIGPDDHPRYTADPVTARYLRRYVGARELLRSEDRWCLWLVDLDPEDVKRSPLLKSRSDSVRKWREDSKAKQAQDAAVTPHLFWYRSHSPSPHLVVPGVSSETRMFLPCGHFDESVISSNADFTGEDPDGFAFEAVS